MPAIHSRRLQEEYARIASEYAATNATNIDERALKEFAIALPSKAKVLDLGCGTGRDAEWFVQRGFEVTLSDLSQEMLWFAQQRVPTATVVCQDMLDISFQENSFHGVWVNGSLHHVTKAEAQEVVSRLYALLQEDGIVYICVKKGKGESEIVQEKTGYTTKRFFSLYSQLEAKRLLETAGFRFVLVRNSKMRHAQWVHVYGKK